MEYLIQMGFSNKDVLLLWSCPIAGAIGSFAHAIMLFLDFTTMKKPKDQTLSPLSNQSLFELVWLTYRLVLGAITGLVLSLYFLGALDEQPSTIARIWGLAIAIGYIAPKLWIKQEYLIESFIDKKLKELVEGAKPEIGKA